ncbi:nitrilase-related carbon-nitrogen hydrolase [Lutimonas zeaxanthinifaciens]|uniref:nitrilase-related carbon-nitrogen hydrolase n=1 Tax=Lutimonas zeaxanthinifaciens TaxID=3060215 RepID=UPI00265CAF44|nr:carbon-nitrogen hydrolase family protein [Lutimonas sp. YSD2104]WKK67501.1 nitrilase-related carbon-nitrogen hydrolase [Lutimonas sp. YSD2104]
MSRKKYEAIACFMLGFGLFMFTRLSNLVPFISFAIVIAPIFILRFIRTQSRKRGIWLTLLGFILSMNIALWGLFQMEDPWLTYGFGAIRSTILALIWFLPFMVDHFIYPRFKDKGAWSTLTFPIVATGMFYLTSLEGPFDDGAGTLSSFSYNYGSHAFTQIRSIFGVWALVFIHSWLYATINYLWEQNFRWSKVKNAMISYTAVYVLVFVFGFVKMSLQKEVETVKIASVVLMPEDGNAVSMTKYFDEGATSPFDETLIKIEALTRKATEQGAKIVSFQEYSILVNEEDLNRLRSEFQRIAREHKVYLSITYAYYGKEEKGENIHLFIDEKGTIQLDYAKRFLLGIGPYGETAVFKKGAEIIQSLKTPYGKIGISICRDMSFPSYIRQAAQSDVDIMLSPSYDFPRSYGPWYITNTIENGFSMVRPTYNGYSYAADYNGAVITHMHFGSAKDGIMYADVPTKGIKVIYPVIGDVLGWLNLLIMIVLIGWVIFSNFNRKKVHAVA